MTKFWLYSFGSKYTSAFSSEKFPLLLLENFVTPPCVTTEKRWVQDPHAIDTSDEEGITGGKIESSASFRLFS